MSSETGSSGEHGEHRAPVSLRERKKANTRRELVAVSQRLFATKGYAQTTLEDICAEVQIRPQTLLRYFDSKAHLAMAPLSYAVEELRRKITDPNRQVRALELWREHVEYRTHYHQMRSAAAVRQYHRWTSNDAALEAMAASLNHQTQQILVTGIRADAETDPADLRPTLLAAMLVAGWNTVFARWLHSGETVAQLGDRQLEVIEQATAILPILGA